MKQRNVLRDAAKLACCMTALLMRINQPAAIAAPLYRLTELETLGGSGGTAKAINDAGQIVGASALTNAPNVTRATRWAGGTITDISPTSGTYSVAFGLNGAGEAVGTATPSGTPSSGSAAVWTSPTMALLPISTPAIAYAVNDNGVVIGESDGRLAGFIYDHGAVTYVGRGAFGINNSGEVVGYMNSQTGVHAFAWNNGITTDLGTLGGNISGAYAVTAQGMIVGYANEGTNTTDYAVMWDQGVIHNLGTLYGFSVAYDINNSDQIVGASRVQSNDLRAVTWIDGELFDLNDLLASPAPGVTLTSAKAINENGWIVGDALFPDGGHGFLLTPLPEPASIVLFAFGMIGVVVAGRRRMNRAVG